MKLHPQGEFYPMKEDLQLLRLPEVAELLGIGESTWLKWVDAGIAPPGFLLSPRTRVWRRSEIKNFIEEREAESTT